MLQILGERLKALREGDGLTQEALAEELDITRLSVGNYERGIRTPDAETIIDIADFFEVSADYLLGRSDERYAPGQVAASGWQNKLLTEVTNAINGFFVEYNEYRESENLLDCGTAFYYSIYGSLNVLLDKHIDLVAFLKSMNEYTTTEEVDRAIGRFLDSLGSFYVGGWKEKDGSLVNSITDFEVEFWLLEELEKKIPGYKEYRGRMIKDWLKNQKE